jgi:hypothetical protein
MTEKKPTNYQRPCTRCGGAQVARVLAGGRVPVWACQRPACFGALERVQAKQLATTND